MRKPVVASTLLGFLSLAAPAHAQRSDATTSGASTYVPGVTEARPYSTRNTSVATDTSPPGFARHRGGGPGTTVGAASRGVTGPLERGPSRGGTVFSDNQTRRPGAANYRGASFDTGRGQHSIPSAPGVSMVGDNFRSRTSSFTVGPIPQRAPASNENEPPGLAPAAQEPAPARGGGPPMTPQQRAAQWPFEHHDARNYRPTSR